MPQNTYGTTFSNETNDMPYFENVANATNIKVSYISQIPTNLQRQTPLYLNPIEWKEDITSPINQFLL